MTPSRTSLAFARVWRSPPRVPQRDYVLGRFSDEQRPKIDQALDRAADALAMWIEQGLNPAMNRFNAEEEKKT